MTLDAVSLFSNCGAGDVGYRDAGFRFVIMAELLAYRLDVAAMNHPGTMSIPGDLRGTLTKVVDSWRSLRGGARPALVAACPPCQGMSSARSGRGREWDASAGSRDPRNLLVEVIADAVAELRPRVVVVENVPAFMTRQVNHPRTGTAISAALLLLERLSADYKCFSIVADLADFGVPQTRRRSFLTFIDRSESGALSVLERTRTVPYPAPSHVGRTVTLRQSLAGMNLPELDAASPESARDPDRPMHIVPVWTPERYEMVAAIPKGTGATAWQNSRCHRCGDVDPRPDDATCSVCGQALLRPVVAENGGVRLIIGFRRSSYARMHPDRPAAAITTASGRIGSDNTLHPWENRVLSVLECQLLQTIPADFRWGDALAKKGHTRVREMIGEAVPPGFTRQYGRVLAALLAGRRPYRLMPESDERVKRANRMLERAKQLAHDYPPVDRMASTDS